MAFLLFKEEIMIVSTEVRTRTGFTLERLHDAFLLWGNLSDSCAGTRQASFHLVTILECIEEEDIEWEFEQVVAYLCATAMDRRISRRKTRDYTLHEHAHDDSYMMFAAVCMSKRYSEDITPEKLHTRLTVHLMTKHHPQYDTVLYALQRSISNGDNAKVPYLSINNTRRAILTHINYIRASKIVTESVKQTHAALCYALMLFH
jgi:hypothetical protein